MTTECFHGKWTVCSGNTLWGGIQGKPAKCSGQGTFHPSYPKHHSCLFLPSAPANHWATSLPLWICLFWAFHLNGPIQYVLSCLASFPYVFGSSSFLKNIFTQYRVLGLIFFFFQLFKDLSPLSSGYHSIFFPNEQLLEIGFLVCNVSFFSGYFQDFLLFLWFSAVVM